MDAVAAIGLAASVVQIAESSMKVMTLYDEFLRGSAKSSGDRFEVLRSQLLIQRTRLSNLSTYITPEVYRAASPLVGDSCQRILQNLEISFNVLNEIEDKYGPGPGPSSAASKTPQRLTNMQRAKWATTDRSRMQDELWTIRKNIDELELILQVHDLMTKENPDLTLEPAPTVLERDRSFISTRSPDNLFMSLLMIGDRGLKALSACSELLKETRLSYSLWASSVTTENIPALYPLMSSQVGVQVNFDLFRTQFQVLSQILHTLVQSMAVYRLDVEPSGKKLLQQMYSEFSRARDSVHTNDVYNLPASDHYTSNEKAMQEFIADELRILVDTLLDSLPTLIHFARSQPLDLAQDIRSTISQPIDIKQQQSGSTKELLEISMELSASIEEAFEEMSTYQEFPKPRIKESLRTLYKKEIEALSKWKAANGPKLDGNVTVRNQHVWEALQTTVFNVTDLLNAMSGQAKPTKIADPELNAKADKLLAEFSQTHIDLDLSVDFGQDPELSEMIRDLGELVQTLTNMDVPLELIEPPPLYEERHADKVVF